MAEKGKLLVVSGSSGSGKGTVLHSLLERYDNFAYSISMTTRDPREGEVDGKNYYFTTEENFKRIVAEDGFLEYAEFVDRLYGTPKAPVERMLEQGMNVILEIEVCGAMQIRQRCKDAVLIFISPASYAELQSRLVGRGTETPEKIKERLEKARLEALSIPSYDYLVINECGKADETADAIVSIAAGTYTSDIDKAEFSSNFLNNIS